jgi:2-phospho-L-lactate transferase/gluconeogenesis factor (CofD/UPF0052 family)
VLYVANLMTEPGETAGLDLENHVAALASLGRVHISAILANVSPLNPGLLEKYRQEGGQPLVAEADQILGIPVFRFPLLDPEAPMARHHPDLLNQAIRDILPRL